MAVEEPAGAPSPTGRRPRVLDPFKRADVPPKTPARRKTAPAGVDPDYFISLLELPAVALVGNDWGRIPPENRALIKSSVDELQKNNPAVKAVMTHAPMLGLLVGLGTWLFGVVMVYRIMKMQQAQAQARAVAPPGTAGPQPPPEPGSPPSPRPAQPSPQAALELAEAQAALINKAMGNGIYG